MISNIAAASPSNTLPGGGNIIETRYTPYSTVTTTPGGAVVPIQSIQPLSHGSNPLSTGAFAAITVVIVLLIVTGSGVAGCMAWKRKRAQEKHRMERRHLQI